MSDRAFFRDTNIRAAGREECRWASGRDARTGPDARRCDRRDRTRNRKIHENRFGLSASSDGEHAHHGGSRGPSHDRAPAARRRLRSSISETRASPEVLGVQREPRNKQKGRRRRGRDIDSEQRMPGRHQGGNAPCDPRAKAAAAAWAKRAKRIESQEAVKRGLRRAGGR